MTREKKFILLIKTSAFGWKKITETYQAEKEAKNKVHKQRKHYQDYILINDKHEIIQTL